MYALALIIAFFIGGIYSMITLHFGLVDSIKIGLITIIFNLVFYVFIMSTQIEYTLIELAFVFISEPALLIGLRVARRVMAIVLGYQQSDKSHIQRTLIIGAGAAGKMVIDELRTNRGLHATPVVVVDDVAYWMGRDKFFMSSGGGVQEVPCEIHDDVFGSAEEATRGLNRTYAAKVYAVHFPQHNEVWWLYTKGSATENSHAVVYNYAERTWMLHAIVRTCGIGPGNGFANPLLMGSDGKLWRHEIGETRTGAGTIYARSGPLEIGDGEQVMYGDMLIPDEGTAGDVQTYLHARLYPNASAVTFGPFTSANPTGARFSGRQVAIEHRLVNANDGGRVGTFRVKVVAGGER
jgi:hypothetical protein